MRLLPIMPDYSLINRTDLGCGSASFREAVIGAAAANSPFVRVSTVEASRSEGSVWISPVFAQTNGRSGEYRRAAENCVQCARAVSALAFAARAKGRFVRSVTVQNDALSVCIRDLP
jgi:hypothetical protein